MTKQEFMAFSLPYGLKIQTNDKCIEQVKGITGGSYCITDLPKYGMYGDSENGRIILHPLSDLTKQIEHKGEKFVPIIELVKTFEKIHGTPKTKQGKDISGCLFTDSDGNLTVFAYHWKTQSFGSNYYRTPEFINVHYQFPMFKKLIEWHFDISGLIEKEEAIDVNILQENPYK